MGLKERDSVLPHLSQLRFTFGVMGALDIGAMMAESNDPFLVGQGQAIMAPFSERSML